MAQPIGVKARLIPLVSPYSIENGASNRSEVKFSFDIHLNMVRPIGAQVCLGYIVTWSWRSLSLSDAKITAINSKIVERQTWHTYYLINIVSFKGFSFFLHFKV